MNHGMIAMACAICGWVGLTLYHLASLPQFSPANGTFALLCLPYIFFKAATSLLWFNCPLIAIALGAYAIIKNLSDILGWMAILTGFLGITVGMYFDKI